LEKPALVSEEKPAVTTEAKPEVKVASREESGFPLIAGEGEKKVITSGYGKNPDEALAQALRNAVEEAVGTYMTSTTRIENDELIEDKVLSLSRGFIKDFKKLTEDKVEDEYMARVAAIITETKILETLEASGVKVEFKGGLFFQQFAAEKKQKEDEKNIVTEYIKNVPDVSLFNFEMETAKPIKYNPVNNPMRRSRYDVQSDKDLYDIEIKVKISINDNYQRQYTNLKNFISEIAFDNTLIKNQWLFISGTKFVLPIHSKSKIGKHQITQELWKKTAAEYPKAFSYNYSSPSPTVSYGRSRSLNNEWKDDKVEMISYRDYFSKSYAPYVIIFGESQEKRKEKNVSEFSSVEKTNCLVAKLLNEETLSLLNWFGANYFAQPGFKILAHGADVECQLGLVLDDRGNESIQRLNDRAQKSITNDEIVHSKNKDTWNPTAMKTLSYLDRGGRYHIPVEYIVSKKDRRKKAAKAAKKAAGGFAKALAKAAIEQQSKGAISFEKNKADKVDKTVVEMGYSYFTYIGQTIPGFFANMEEPYAEVSFHLILDENEIQKITMLEVQPLGPKSINRDKDN
jgi:hypothetical protein